MNGTLAEQVSAVEQEAFVNIGLAYYEGVRSLKGLKVWLVCNNELKSWRWVKRNPSLAEKWLNDTAGA